MPKYFYIARDNNTGNKITGSEEATSVDELIGWLQARNSVVISITPEFRQDKVGFKAEAAQKRMNFRHYGITSSDLVLFCRQLSILLGAGVTILKSLDIISKQISSRKFYRVIEELEKYMESGLSLHEAMARHPGVFSELWINLVESGEASGNLAVVLNRLAAYLERREAFKKKLISSMIYPIILMLAGIGALLFLTVKIIPTFGELFKGFNVTLPVLTQILIMVSALIRKYILIMLGGLVLLFFMLKAYIKTYDGRKRYESVQLRLPVFGEFFHALVVERFSSGMSTLIESGVPLLYSLEITEHSLGNLIAADIIRKVKEDVREGKPMSQPLEKSGFFEPMVVQMITVGEEIGDLPQMFKRINAYYQEYTEMFLTRLTTMFEPIMLIFMGVVIGLMVLGMFLPIFQIAKIGGG